MDSLNRSPSIKKTKASAIVVLLLSNSAQTKEHWNDRGWVLSIVGVGMGVNGDYFCLSKCSLCCSL